MAASTQNVNPKKCSRCKACGLYLNQFPAYDSRTDADVFWVGLSAVRFGVDEEKRPLSSLTQSGSLITQAETAIGPEFAFYKTNIVKCLPLQDGKIRYPETHEMKKCFPNLEAELNTQRPAIVFLLGKQVASFVLKQYQIKNFRFDEAYQFERFLVGNTYFIPIHHPSYMLVYKRRQIEAYLGGIRNSVHDLLCKQCSA